MANRPPATVEGAWRCGVRSRAASVGSRKPSKAGGA
jgi:hypothetical protein